MELKIEVASEADGKEYGGTQVMQVAVGEFVLDEIFKLNFFRIIIDDVIDGALLSPYGGSGAALLRAGRQGRQRHF